MKREEPTAAESVASSDVLERLRAAAKELQELPPVAVGIVCSPADYSRMREQAMTVHSGTRLLGAQVLPLAVDPQMARGVVDAYYDDAKWRERLQELNERSNMY